MGIFSPQRGRCALAAAASLLGQCGLAAAQEPPRTIAMPASPPRGPAINRPDAARRLVSEFTFDDPEPFVVPRHWDLAKDGSDVTPSRPGYPRWNKAELDTAAAYRGRGSVKLSISGGSVCLRLQPGVIPVFPDAEYLVSAKVRTDALGHARARLTARFLDKANQPIARSESRSELVAAPGPLVQDAGWVSLAANLPSTIDDAAYIQIDLEVLQPEQFETPELGKHQVWAQDFSGHAWFDDVTVVQLPRVSVSTGSPTNVIERPAHPSIAVSIRDLTGEAMTGELVLQDGRGRTIDRAIRPLDSGVSRWNWSPDVTSLGWYRATLELRAGDRRVGSTHVDFAWVDAPEEGPKHAPAGRDAARFGVVVSELPPDQRSTVPELARLLGAGTVSIPVWTGSLKADQVQALAQSLVPMVNALKADWRRISFSLPRIPDELAAAAHVEPEHPLAVFATDAKVWTPYLDPLVDKFGQGVQLWQVGNPGTATSAADVGAPLAALYGELSRLVPGPVIELPWPGELSPPPSLAADTRVDLLASLPGGVPAESLAGLASRWSSAGGASTTLVLQTLSSTDFSRHDAAVAIVKQGVALWCAQPPAPRQPGPTSTSSPDSGGVPNLTLVQPWDWPGAGSERNSVMPRAEFPAYRNLAKRLSGRRVAGMLAVRGGTCYILAPAPDAPPGRTGALVGWQNRASPEPVALDAFLGEGPISLVDLYGNSQQLDAEIPGPVGRSIEEGAAGSGSRGYTGQRTHHVALSDEPVFVEGVDIQLALFAASFALEPSRLLPTTAEHEMAVTLSNPWPTPIEGRLTILEPGGLSKGPSQRDRSWRITPRSTTFSIAPGATSRIPISVSFSAVEESGLKDFIAQVELAGTHDYGPIRLRAALEVGLESSPLDLSYQFNGKDVIVEAQVTNRGSTPATFELSAYATPYARQKASVSDLPPGKSATRRFVFPAGQAKLRGDSVKVRMQDLETEASVNRSITIE